MPNNMISEVLKVFDLKRRFLQKQFSRPECMRTP